MTYEVRSINSLSRQAIYPFQPKYCYRKKSYSTQGETVYCLVHPENVIAAGKTKNKYSTKQKVGYAIPPKKKRKVLLEPWICTLNPRHEQHLHPRATSAHHRFLLNTINQSENSGQNLSLATYTLQGINSTQATYVWPCLLPIQTQSMRCNLRTSNYAAEEPRMPDA